MLTITGGKWARRKIDTTAREIARYTPQAARKALFDIIDVQNKYFLDLFSGSGIMAFEAMSRNGAGAVCMDSSKLSCKTIHNNRRLLESAMNLEVLCVDFRRGVPALVKKGATFDFVFADPPFDQGYILPLLNTLSKNLPLFKRGALSIIETSPREEKTLASQQASFLKIIDRRSYANVVFTFGLIRS